MTDFRALIRLLVHHSVECIIVGGAAATAHGSARLTEDLAVVYRRTDENVSRLIRKAKGAEPDTSFYVQNAARIIGKRQIDLESDPPPDVVVEIDVSNTSSSKFPIYAALGVPEIWLYDGRETRFYQLAGRTYQETPRGLAFPALTAVALAEFLAESKTPGQSAALAAFRRRLSSR